MKLRDRLAQRKLPDRVRKSAGLSAVLLECHRDTWDYALRMMSGPWLDRNHWDKDPSDSILEKPGDESLIQVRLSGARLAELVMLLWWLPVDRRWWSEDTPEGMKTRVSATAAEEEQAKRLYQAIAAVIDRVELNTPRQGDIPTVIIDDATAGAR